MKTRLPNNWRTRIEFSTIDCGRYRGDEICFSCDFKDGKTPEGFRQNIGYLIVSPDGFIESAMVAPRMRRRGIGKALYINALNHFGFIYTKYFEASDAAKQVWKSLIKEYTSRQVFFAGKLIVYKRKKRVNRKNV